MVKSLKSLTCSDRYVIGKPRKGFDCLQATVAKQIRPALYCVITQPTLPIYYRRFGTTHQPSLVSSVSM
jgi:hypothetical protein